MVWTDVRRFALEAECLYYRDLIWQCQVASHPHRKAKDQRQFLAKLRLWAEPPGQRLSVYETVPDDVRVLLIGSALSVGGDQWAREHPAQLAWLSEQGITREQALRMHREQMARDMADARWEKPREKRRRPKLKKKPKGAPNAG